MSLCNGTTSSEPSRLANTNYIEIDKCSDQMVIDAKNLSSWFATWFANNKGIEQPAQLRRLVSAFVIRLLESIIII